MFYKQSANQSPALSIIPIFFSILFSVFVMMNPVQADSIIFEDCWGKAGFNLASQDASGLEIVYSIEKMLLEDISVGGNIMQMVSMPGVILPKDAGAPNLPGYGRYIAIPQGSSANVRIVDYRTEIYTDIDITPAPPIPLDTDDSPPVFEKDPDIYSRNAYYPDSPVEISAPSLIRGIDVVILAVTPFQYNPVTKELIVYRDLRIEVDFIGGNGSFGNDCFRSLYWEPMMKASLLNYASLPKADFNRVRETDEDGFEYIIIIPDDPSFIAWADSIKTWRKLQGISTGVVTLTEIGGNDPDIIEAYLDNAYYNCDIPPAAALILSDYQDSGDLYGITSPIWNDYCVSDNIYADVDGDELPDIAVARITAQNESHLSTIIGKMFDYERQPPADPGFYEHPLIAGGWQDDRWFILCCEVVFGYMQNALGKEPVRQYAGATAPPNLWSSNVNTNMIIEYFGPEGLNYIPESPSYLTNWNGNARGISASINNGAFFTLHRDHGEENGWSSPAYTISNLAELNNDMLTFVFTINCLTGKYNDPSECFTEAFHRMNNGALGLIAASEVSYSFVNDTYVWGMYDSMWPDFDPGYGADETGCDNLRPCFSNVYGKYYLEVSNWPSNPNNKIHTYNLFHHHGDAFLTLYSEVPQELNMVHDPTLQGGLNQITISADEGAIIALTVGGEIIGLAEAAGAAQDIQIVPQIPGDEILVTATLYNHYRYMETVTVTAPSWPYVVFSDVEINDENAWLPNSQLDYNETILLTISANNIGNSLAAGVDINITSEDTYTTIIDGFESYGNIAANSIISVDNGFEIEASPVIPDLHEIEFQMTATDGDSIWASDFIIIAHAPRIEYYSLLIEDISGNNNNHLDPGETADFHLTMINNGSSYASGIQLTLSTDTPGIIIPNPLASITELSIGAEAAVLFEDIQADESIQNGTDIDFELGITADENFTGEDIFTIMVGDYRYLPSQPDNYGYYALDSYDGANAPVYDWYEIAVSAGGPGTALSIGNNATAHLDLPFTFKFYGVDHSEISICSNGWITLGYTGANSAYNNPIPFSYFPYNFVGAFWDDLSPGTSGEICHYYDETNHRLIVEWYQVPLNTGTGTETFQVMFYDPAYYPTGTGDGEIQVNYHTVEDPTSVTAGIENSDATDGLQYLYNEEYDFNAMPLENGFAIKYSTGIGVIDDITISVDLEDIVLDWSDLAAASVYHVYRSTEPYFEVIGTTPIGDSDTSDYTDAGAASAGIYFYRVTWE